MSGTSTLMTFCLFVKDDRLILRRGGGAGKFCRQIIYSQLDLDRKIYFHVYQGQNIYFRPQQNFEPPPPLPKKRYGAGIGISV